MTSTLWIRVRTSGEASLNRLGLGMNELRIRMRHLANNIRSHLGPHMDRLRGMFTRMRGALGPLARGLGELGKAFGQLVGMVSSALGPVFKVVGGLASMVGIWGALVPVIIAATGALLQVAPAAFTIPAAIAAAAGAMIVFKMALNGVGDALKAGFEGDLEKYNEALKKLTPSAQAFVKQIVALRKEWVPIQRLVQQSFFEGLAPKIKAVSDVLKPLAKTWLPAIAQAFNRTFKQILDWLASPSGKSALELTMVAIWDVIRNIAGAIPPVIEAFVTLAAGGGKTLGEMTGNVKTLAEKFRDWVNQMKDSGKLQEWLDKAKKGLGDIADIGKNLAETIGAIFTAGDKNGKNLGFLESIKKATKELSDWAKSENGQALMHTMMDAAAAIIFVTVWLVRLGGGLIRIAELWRQQSDLIKGLYNVFVTAFQGMLNFFFTWVSMILAGLVKAFGDIPGLGPKLKKAQSEFAAFAAGVNNELNKIKAPVLNFQVTASFSSEARSVMKGGIKSLGGTVTSGIKAAASGGTFRRGQVALVGEEGPEIVTFGSGGRVHSTSDSARMVGNSVGSGGGVARIEFVGEQAIVDFISKLVRARGGNVQTVFGRTA